MNQNQLISVKPKQYVKNTHREIWYTKVSLNGNTEGRIKNMTMMIMKKQEKVDYSYLAGLIDGDGCILAQIVKREDYKYKYEIRVSVTLYQKTKRH